LMKPGQCEPWSVTKTSIMCGGMYSNAGLTTTASGALSTCVQLAHGNVELLPAFLGVQHINAKAIDEARRIYSHLDIDEFFDWASDHFGLDDYYDDAQELVDHLQDMIKDNGSLLFKDDLHPFMADIVDRSGLTLEFLAVEDI
jgi:hypothetical protein